MIPFNERARSPYSIIGMSVPFFGKDRDVQPTPPTQDSTPVFYSPSNLPSLEELENSEDPLERERLIKEWADEPIEITNYPAGYYPDGTPYSGGQRLYIGKKGERKQVMDSWESPWVDKTEAELWRGIERKVALFEAGAGLNMMAAQNLDKMSEVGGLYVLTELNHQVFAKTKRFFEQAIPAIKRAQNLGLRPKKEIEFKFGETEDIISDYLARGTQISSSKLTILICRGDAYKAIKRFPSEFFNLVSLDLHQLKDEEIGLDNLRETEEVFDRIAIEGRFTLCSFHKKNQTGIPDWRQSKKLTELYEQNVVIHQVLAHPPADSSYSDGPTTTLPVVICTKTKGTRAA